MAGFNQRVGPDIVPPDPTWHDAAPAARLEFFREAGRRMVLIKRDELSRGIGSNGRRMAPRKRPRPDGATGPVLTPHREDSRTARLMAAHATVESVTLFWRSGHSKAQRLPWGTVLGFHARGEVRGAPVRDVRLSRKGINRLKAEMFVWWAEHHAKRLRAERQRREEAEAEERRKKPKTPGRMVAKARDALVKKYPGLKPYLTPPGGRGGF